MQETRRQVGFVRKLGPNAPYARRNHRLGVTAGLFAGVARDFFHPEVILVAFIFALTGSYWMAALIPICNKLGALTPQLLTGVFLEHRDRRTPYFRIVTVVRVASFLVLLGSMFMLVRDVNALGLTLFFAVYLVNCVTGGTGHVIFMDMIGRLIPSHRVGAFLSTRSLLSSAVSIVTSLLIVQTIISAVEFPNNYLLLVAIGTVLVAVDMGTWSLCREKPGHRARQRTSLGEALKRGFQWLATHHNYRCYLLSRVAFRFCYLGLAFFVPYGQQRLARDGAAAVVAIGGIMVFVMKGSSFISSLLWGKIADQYGSKVTMVGGGVFLVAAPLVALLSPHLPGVFEIPIWSIQPAADGWTPRLVALENGLDLALVVYLAAFGLLHFGVRAYMLGGQRFLITTAPPQRRASYVAFLNTITSPLTLMPLLGAAVAEWFGMDALFAAVAFGGFLAIGAAMLMQSDRHTALKGNG
ncbi:MAG: hypothetical protein ACLFUJ_06050 [Phycisphaerae bacterium]